MEQETSSRPNLSKSFGWDFSIYSNYNKLGPQHLHGPTLCFHSFHELLSTYLHFCSGLCGTRWGAAAVHTEMIDKSLHLTRGKWHNTNWLPANRTARLTRSLSELSKGGETVSDSVVWRRTPPDGSFRRLVSASRRSAWSSWVGRSAGAGTWGCKGAGSWPAWWRSPSTRTTAWWWSTRLARDESRRSEWGGGTKTRITTHQFKTLRGKSIGAETQRGNAGPNTHFVFLQTGKWRLLCPKCSGLNVRIWSHLFSGLDECLVK